MSESTTAETTAVGQPLPGVVFEDISDTDLVDYARDAASATNPYVEHVAANWERARDVKAGTYSGPQGPAQAILNLWAPPGSDADTDNARELLSSWQDAVTREVRAAANSLETDDDDKPLVTIFLNRKGLGFFPAIDKETGEHITAQDEKGRERRAYRLHFVTRNVTKRAKRTPASA